MFGSLGALEIGIIAFVLVLIFGPSQLPKLGRSIGATIKEFRGAGKELQRALDDDDDRRPAA